MKEYQANKGLKVSFSTTIGTSVTINKDVGENELVIPRIPARTIQNWQRPLKK